LGLGDRTDPSKRLRVNEGAHDDDGEDGGVAVAPGQFGHVLEVHAVHAGDHGGYCDEGGHGADAAHVGVLLDAELGGAGVEDADDQFVGADHALGGALVVWWSATSRR
jgi:hypothetical protein